MKKYLKNIKRKFDLEDKSKYDYVLNQSERTKHLPEELYQKFLSTLTQEDFFFYPHLKNFKEKLSKFYGVESNQIFICAGSDVGIKSVFETFTNKGKVISSEPAFPMYKVYSELYQCGYIQVPHEKDFTISIDKLLSWITWDTQLIVLANPNSPMGEYKSFDDIKPLLDTGIPTLIDEAYVEFTDNESMIQYINEYSNLIITRTFSKGFGAAGCRVGCVISNKDNINLIGKFRHMYEISGVSMKYCEFLLDNYNLVETYVEDVKEEKKKLISKLSSDYEIIDSNCNWIHFNNEVDNIDTMRTFENHKVLVKYSSVPHDDRKNWCRLTIQPNISKEKFFKELLNVYK